MNYTWHILFKYICLSLGLKSICKGDFLASLAVLEVSSFLITIIKKIAVIDFGLPLTDFMTLGKSHSISMCLNFLHCKMGIIVLIRLLRRLNSIIIVKQWEKYLAYRKHCINVAVFTAILRMIGPYDRNYYNHFKDKKFRLREGKTPCPILSCPNSL